MFLKNVSKTFQSFSYNDGKRQRQIAPGETVSLIDAKDDDVAIQMLVSLGDVQIVDGPDGSKAFTDPVVPTEMEDPNETEVLTTVHCPAVFKNGNDCNAVVQLKEGEAYEDAPHFCGRHKDENPDDYELIDGKWTKTGGAKQPEKPEDGDDGNADDGAKAEADEKAAEANEKPAEAPKGKKAGATPTAAPDDAMKPLTPQTARPVFDNE